MRVHSIGDGVSSSAVNRDSPLPPAGLDSLIDVSAIYRSKAEAGIVFGRRSALSRPSGPMPVTAAGRDCRCRNGVERSTGQTCDPAGQLLSGRRERLCFPQRDATESTSSTTVTWENVNWTQGLRPAASGCVSEDGAVARQKVDAHVAVGADEPLLDGALMDPDSLADSLARLYPPAAPTNWGCCAAQGRRASHGPGRERGAGYNRGYGR